MFTIQDYLDYKNPWTLVYMFTIQDYLDYTNPWALGALAFAGIGLVMTIITMG